MTGTYRRTLAWTVDGVNQTRRRANSLAKIKPISRRAKRLEHKLTTSEAVRSYYADGADDRYDYLYGDDYMDDYFDNRFMEPEWDEHEDYIEDDDYDYGSYDFYDHDPYDDYLDDYWGSSPISVEERTYIQPEDVGRSLGDILEEIRQKQGL